jgi:mannan endo-1,4-beta-mannosidase
MSNPRLIHRLLVVSFFGLTALRAADPVTPNASPEARALLKLLDDVSGRYTFTGQHNYPNTKDHNSVFAANYTGEMPVVYGIDMGHAVAGNSDSYLARPDIVKECIRQHHAGSLVTICWHAVPPTGDEPTTFSPQPGADPKHLKSVQGQLLDEQFHELLTPGTPLHRKWEQQVDVIAGFLAQLRDAHVPVLWRPYHEMNGNWFWWGGRGADTAALYRMMFDRYTQVHHLDNLIWVWSVDRVHSAQMEHAKYFPGLAYVDVLALDVYGNDFGQAYYDSLVTLSQGKPLALAEVGNPPSPEILAKQPRWTWYMIWAGMVRNTSPRTYETLFADPRVVNRNDRVYAMLTADYRKACGLPPLPAPTADPDFSGRWVIDDALSTAEGGLAPLPAKLEVQQHGDKLTIRASVIREWGDDETSTETLTLGGDAVATEVEGRHWTTTVRRSDTGALTINATAPARSDANELVTRHETWRLQRAGRELLVDAESKSPRGTTHATLVYRKE